MKSIEKKKSATNDQYFFSPSPLSLIFAIKMDDLPDEKLSDLWAAHWMSSILDISLVTFIPVEADPKKYQKMRIANQIYPHVKEELCTVAYAKIKGKCSILDVFVPSLGKIPPVFQLGKPPDLVFGDLLCGGDDDDDDDYSQCGEFDIETDKSYRDQFKKCLSARYWDSVDFGIENVGKTCSVNIFCSENWEILCNSVETMEYPVTHNPRMVALVRKRLRLLDYLESALRPNALLMLQNGSVKCICRLGTRIDIATLIAREPLELSGLIGTPRGNGDRDQECETLSRCVSRNCSDLYDYMKKMGSFSGDLHTDTGRMEDFFGFYWLLTLCMYDRSLWEKVKIYEPLFGFLKLQIYARSESDLLAACEVNSVKILPANRNKRINKELKRVNHPLNENRQISENALRTEFRIYDSCTWWNVGALVEEYPGTLLVEYPILGVYLSLLTRKLIEDTLSKFYRNSLSVSITRALSGQCTGPLCQEQIDEILVGEVNYRMSKLDTLYPDFERTIMHPLSDDITDNTKTKIKIIGKPLPGQSYHSSSNRITGCNALPEDISDLLKLKRGELQEDEIVAKCKSRLCGGPPEPDKGVVRYCEEIEKDRSLMFPPCVVNLFATIENENRHPRNDERYLVMSFLYDLGFDAFHIAATYKELFTDSNLCEMEVSEFLNSGEYGTGLVDGLKRLARRSSENSETRGSSRLSWNCASMCTKGLCSFFESDGPITLDIEDIVSDKTSLATQRCVGTLVNRMKDLQPPPTNYRDNLTIHHPVEYVSMVQDYFY